MTCGIYRLTFPSGRFYIGKSIDIDKRWKQHFDDFEAGKHTRLMQPEFNKYRQYEQEVICECHSDYLTILEDSYIARFKPPLNGTFPKDRFNCPEHMIETATSYFGESIVGRVLQLHHAKGELVLATDKIRFLEDDVRLLKIERSDSELAADITNRIVKLREKVTTLDTRNGILEHELSNLNVECQELWKYKKLPWYKKLFN
jgi:hypothetical protein